MDAGLVSFLSDPAFVLSLLVGSFHTCVYVFVRGKLGWHLPLVLLGAILGALAAYFLVSPTVPVEPDGNAVPALT